MRIFALILFKYMNDTQEFFQHCQAWYQGDQGSFMLENVLQLTKQMVSPWPRRGHSLLEIGCGHWKSLEMLWQSGFDVSSIATAQMYGASAHSVLGGKVDIGYGALDHLPFQDNFFDYVVLMLPPQKTTYPPLLDILTESARLAAKGILLQFWNPFSCTGLLQRMHRLPLFLEHAFWTSWRDVLGILRTLCPQGAWHMGSILYTNPATWQKKNWLRTINSSIFALPLGALIQLRFDFNVNIPLTGVPLRFDALQGNITGMKVTDPISTVKNSIGTNKV